MRILLRLNGRTVEIRGDAEPVRDGRTLKGYVVRRDGEFQAWIEPTKMVRAGVVKREQVRRNA